MKKLILTSLFLTAQLFSYSSHAALFDDTEARKKILEVEKNMQTQNQATQAALAELKSKQQALEQRVTALEGIAKGGSGRCSFLNHSEVPAR
jgi:cell division protein FtsB